MEPQKYLINKSTLLNYLHDYFDDNEDDENLKKIKKFIEEKDLFSNHDEIKSFLQMISKISNNHNRRSNFIEKIEQILLYAQPKINEFLANDEIYRIFKSNKRILLFLFENKIVVPNKNIFDIMSRFQYQNSNFNFYFFNEIQLFIENTKRHEIEQKIRILLSNSKETFEEKRKNGNNDSYLCYLIQNDFIDDFIIYINQTNLSLSSKISQSIFETNSLLLKNDPTIIEYTAFYGASQIFRFLCLNRVQLYPSLWIYAIHGRNPDIIHLLEVYQVQLCDPKKILKESIKCHHNEISEYIQNITNQNEYINDNSIFKQSIKSYNYLYFPKNITNEETFYDFCKYDYYPIVKMILMNKSVSFKLNKAYKAASEKENNEIIQLLINFKGIEDRSFEDCTSLKQIEIPSIVTLIGSNVFSGCSKLAEIKIPFSVKSIGDMAFQNCISLKTIEIPSSITSIGNGTFSGCSALKKLVIPSSVTSIGDNAFWGCNSLLEMQIPQKVTAIHDYTFFECNSLQKVFIPFRIKSIGAFAFWGCSSLLQLLVPSSLVSIGNYAFAGCTSISEMNFPSSVKNIGSSVFERCSSLTKIFIQPTIYQIGESIFSSCSSLKQIKIPSSVVEIDEAAFWGCTALDDVDIPSSVKSIGNNAFWGCSSLVQISIPCSVNSIGEYAFFGCTSLSRVINHGFLKTIGKYAFSECFNLKEIDIPDSIIEIGENAFQESCALRTFKTSF